MDKWRSTHIKLVIFEFIVSVLFFVLGYSMGDAYFRGVGVGLLIAWVTGALALFVMRWRTSGE